MGKDVKGNGHRQIKETISEFSWGTEESGESRQLR
jgi:hypothetical protein